MSGGVGEGLGVEELRRKEVKLLKGHEGAVLAARFDADGNYCLSCSKGRTICLWNPRRGIHIKTYKSHCTPDNSKLCSCGGDRQIFYWELGTAVQCVLGTADSVMCVCLTKTEITDGSVDGTVRTFDIHIEISDDLGQPINCISFSNDGNCKLASCLDSTLPLLDRSTGELFQEYKGHTCKVRTVPSLKFLWWLLWFLITAIFGVRSNMFVYTMFSCWLMHCMLIMFQTIIHYNYC